MIQNHKRLSDEKNKEKNTSIILIPFVYSHFGGTFHFTFVPSSSGGWLKTLYLPLIIFFALHDDKTHKLKHIKFKWNTLRKIMAVAMYTSFFTSAHFSPYSFTLPPHVWNSLLFAQAVRWRSCYKVYIWTSEFYNTYFT